RNLSRFRRHTHCRSQLQDRVARHTIEYCRRKLRCNQLAVGNEHHIHYACFVYIFMVARVGPKHLVETLVTSQQGRVKCPAVVSSTFCISGPAFCCADKMILHLHAERLAEIRPDGACHYHKQIFVGNLDAKSRLRGEDYRTNIQRRAWRRRDPSLVDFQEGVYTLNKHLFADGWHAHPFKRTIQTLAVPLCAKHTDVAVGVAKSLETFENGLPVM